MSALLDLDDVTRHNPHARAQLDYLRRERDHFFSKSEAQANRIAELEHLCNEVEALRQNAERWLLIRFNNKTRVQVVRDGAWHTLFYGGHGNAEDAIDALRGEGEK